MSRVVQVSDSQSSHPTSYDSGYSAYSLNNPTRAYKDSGDTTNYAQVNLVRGQGAETSIYFNFSFNIPSGATITAVSCTATCLINRTVATNITTRQIQLYAGSTPKGSASDVVNSTNLMTLDAGNANTWSASDVNNAKLRLYAVRGAVNTTSNYYFRLYGATMSVSYTYNQTEYEVTCTSTAPNVHVGNSTDHTHTYYVASGGNQNIELVGDLTGANVTDNGTDITSSVSNNAISLTNVIADHTILIFIPEDKIYIKKSSAAFQVGSATSSYYDTSNVVAIIPAGTIVPGDIVRVVLTNIRRWYSGSWVLLGDYEVEFERTATYGSTRQYCYCEGTSGKGVAILQIHSNYQLEVRPYDSRQTSAEYDGTLKVYKIENNVWVEVLNVYVKDNGTWQIVSEAYKKDNGSWSKQDKSAMFDPNALFSKG